MNNNTRIFLLTLLSCMCNASFAQTSMMTQTEIKAPSGCSDSLREEDKLPILKMKIINGALIAEIEKLIQLKFPDSIANSQGYIEVNRVHHGYPGKQVIQAYQIKPQYLDADERSNDFLFPLFYTYIRNRLVAIFDRDLASGLCYQIKEDSKLEYQKVLEPYLAKAQWITMPSIDGTKKRAKFRPDNWVQIHGGKTLYLFADGSSLVE